MRIFFALIFCIAISFIVSPIGGIIIFVLILLFGKKKPVQQTISQNVYVTVNNEPKKAQTGQEIEPKIDVVGELDILNKKFKRKLITAEEYQERVKQLSANNSM
jgi:hypothetical protein